MLGERFNALRARLDELKAGKPPAVGLLERARALLLRDDGDPSLEKLRALDRDLERVGIHTTADARLLKELGEMTGRAGDLSRGLLKRATEALRELELALRDVEWAALGRPLQPGTLTSLEDDYVRLGRAVKVAAVFAAPSAPFQIFAPPKRSGRAPASARLAAAAYFAQRAQQNVLDTGQKRRDLDLAHELLMRLSSEAKEDREWVRQLGVDVSLARDRVRSVPVVRSLNDLIRHLRHTARRDPRTAYRSLRALSDRAVEAGDLELARVAGEAVVSLLPEPKQVLALVRNAELRESMGWKELAPGGKSGVGDEVAEVLTQLAFELDESRLKALELAAGASRLFDLEGSLSEELVEAELKSTRPVQRRVPYPTQSMSYEYTNNLDEVHNFVVTPGSLILDLASNRQTVRSYLEEEPPPQPKKLKKTAVRVYVLDASGSMYGARARFRDAILIAELNAMRVKARVNLPFDPLYYSYFNDSPTELHRVDSGPEATRRIEQLFREAPAEGQTDITLALMGAFDSIRNAVGKDPYLARATVVLVTDGEDGVDLELIRKTKRPFEGLDISLSFISLGEENSDLKALVLEQRQQGSRAFYHHLTDAEIGLAHTAFDSAWRTLLPSDAPVTGDVLEKLLPHLEALEALAQNRPVQLPERLEAQFDALFPKQGAAGRPGNSSARLTDILEAVAEAASLASADARTSEAVQLLHHLLKLYGIPVPEYLEAIGSAPPVSQALSRVRLICQPFD